MTTIERLDTATEQRTHAATILEKSVVLTLSCHYFGNTRVIDVDDLVEAASDTPKTKDRDLSQFHATKRLLDAKELRPVMRVLGLVKRYLHKTALPGARVFGERSYLVPLALVKTVDETLEQFQRQLRAEADALALRYNAAILRAQIALGSQFNASDYVGAAGVTAAFGIDWSYVSFAVPDRLETVSHVLATRANQEYQARLTQAYDEVLVGLRAAALDVMRGLAERLAPGPDGKPKTLKSTALHDLQTFMLTLPARNLTEDGELTQAVHRVSAMAQGLDVAMLRDSDASRAALQAVAAEASTVLAGLVQGGRRPVSFDGSLDW